MNKTRKKINQWACYNRIWSWSPMPCEKHGPQASVTTKTSAFSLGFCLPSPSGHVFHTAWEIMIKSYTIMLYCEASLTPPWDGRSSQRSAGYSGTDGTQTSHGYDWMCNWQCSTKVTFGQISSQLSINDNYSINFYSTLLRRQQHRWNHLHIQYSGDTMIIQWRPFIARFIKANIS